MVVVTHLSDLRKQQGLSAAELAKQALISRQTVYAIEDGSFVPNTVVALRLAAALHVTVEQLFALPPAERTSVIDAQILARTGENVTPGQVVNLVEVGDKLIGVPVLFQGYLPVGDATVVEARGTRGRLSVVNANWQRAPRLLVAGCDPALSLLADSAAEAGVPLLCVPCSSQQALRWLRDGLVHAAGSHLRDHDSGKYNTPQIRRLFGRRPVHVITFAHWRQGLAVSAGNPKHIGGVADLVRPEVSIVNREEGSGSRDLLLHQLSSLGIATSGVRGWSRTADGHLAAAEIVAAQQADCCLANEAAARCRGLSFVPLAVERFDLAWSADAFGLRTSGAVLDILNNARFRSRLQTAAGYDISETGNAVV